MKKIKHAITKFIQDEKGLTTVEYCIVGGVISAATIAAINALGNQIETQITELNSVLTS